MKITGIKVKDYLIIKELELGNDNISPKLNIFLGKNRSGKTSIIKAIETGLLGTTDPSVIRIGSDKSEIQIDIDGLLKVHRTITPKGQRLKVINETGDIKSNPQTFLSSLLGNFSFDPITFVTLQGKERVKYLQELFKTTVKPEDLKDAGVDDDSIKRLDFTKDGLSVLKDAENIIYARRAEVNKQVNQKWAVLQEGENKLSGFDPNSYEPDKIDRIEKETQNIKSEITRAQALKTQQEKNERLRLSLQNKIDQANKELDEIPVREMLVATIKEDETEFNNIVEQIKKLEAQLAKVNERILQNKNLLNKREKFQKDIAGWQETLGHLDVVDIPDIGTLTNQLKEYEEEYRKALAESELYETWLEVEQDIKPEYLKLKKESERLTAILDSLRKDLPQKISKEANIPIENLRFEGDKIFVGDKSIDNMSTSEQVAFALKIVRELNKDKPLKVMCLDRVESLDEDTLKEFERQIEDDDWQYFLTRVWTGDETMENAFFVEDGKVMNKDGKRLE